MHRLRTRREFTCMASAAFLGSSVTSGASQEMDRHDSGFPDVNKGLYNILSETSELFGLRGDWSPDFAFYDDEPANSDAGPPIRNNGVLLSRPRVRIGRNLVKEILARTHGDFGVALSGVIAHEFAHVYQMMSGEKQKLLSADARKSERLTECHADFLAGWALPQYYWITRTGDLALAASQFYELGDREIELSGHHGTSIQRQSVMACGYTWGLISPNDVKGASSRAWAVFEDLFPDWLNTKK